jgi:hypothetical protein
MRRPPQRASGAAYKARLNGHDGNARGNDGNGEATYTSPSEIIPRLTRRRGGNVTHLPLRSSRDSPLGSVRAQLWSPVLLRERVLRFTRAQVVHRLERAAPWHGVHASRDLAPLGCSEGGLRSHRVSHVRAALPSLRHGGRLLVLPASAHASSVAVLKRRLTLSRSES